MAFTAAISSAIFSSPVWSDPAPAPANYSLNAPGSIAVPGGVVPDGTCGVTVSATGAGGASSSVVANGGNGGAGAVIGASFRVLPLQAVTGTVAQGGIANNTNTGAAGGANGGTGNAAGGAGGGIIAAGVTGSFHRGGGGGGSTATFVGGIKLLEAGGGGGAGTGHSATGGGGGAGFTGIATGVAAGTNGTAGNQNIGNAPLSTATVGAGQGGQIAAGGTGGTNTGTGVNGLNGLGIGVGTGGAGALDANIDSGGGGGGGYTGGGGGSSNTSTAQSGAGGGGGSSFVRLTSPTATATATTGITGAAGTNGASGNNLVANGGNGAVTLSWIPCNYTLAVTKSASPTPVNAGAKTTWTIAITNTGPDPMSRSDTISLADTLPGPVTGTPNYRVLTIANTGGTNSTDLTNDPITCTGVTVGSTMPAATTCTRPYNSSPSPGGTVGNNGTRGLNPGETLTITYEQIFPNTAACQSISNVATYQDRAAGVNTGNKTATGTATIACYDLSVAKTVSQTSTATGTVLTWNVQVTNNGPANMFGPDATTANNLSVNDPAPTANVGLPTNFTSTGPATGCTYTSPTISCTSGLNAGQTQTFTFQQTINAGTAVGTNISNTASVTDFNPADVDSITRTFTVPAPSIQITKVGVGGGGTFTFNGTNGFGADSIVVPAAGGTTAGAVKPLTAINTATTVTEAIPAGWTPALTSCTGAVAGSYSFTPGTGALAFTTAAIQAGNVIQCTITNTRQPTLSLQKAIGAPGRIAANDQFTLSGTGTGAPASINTTGAGTAVTSAAYNFTATIGAAYSLNEAMAAGSTSVLGKYTQAVVCANSWPTANGGTNVTGLTTLPINVTPVAGDAITCTLTNTPKAPTLALQKVLGGAGRIAVADQFSLSGTGTGAPAAVTTTGAGTAVTSAAFSFTATAGSAYVLNEAMAAGSTSSLLQYTQGVACTNALVGGTNVSGLTTLPINVTPAFGDAISCNVTNSPRATTLQLAKTWGTNNIATDTAAIGPTTGGTANTLAFTANAGTPNNSGAPVNIAAGNTINLPAETFSSGTVGNYNTSLACATNLGATTNAVSSANGQNPNTLLIAANDTGKNITCTYNNTRRSTQFRLTKTWDAASTAGDVANFAATSGLITNTNSFSSTALTSSSSNTVTVYAGEQATLPAETMSVGTLATYLTPLSCNAGTLVGTNGQTPGNTLAITALATATNPIVCTYANTKVNASLTISKVATYSPSPVIKDQLVTYTYKIFNNGNVPITNVQVRDMHGTPAVQISLGASGITSETLSIPGPGGFAASPDSTPNNGIWTTLAPGAEVTFTYVHQVTQAEIDNG